MMLAKTMSLRINLDLPGDCLFLKHVLDVLADKVCDFGLDISWRHSVDTGKACPFHSDGFACNICSQSSSL